MPGLWFHSLPLNTLMTKCDWENGCENILPEHIELVFAGSQEICGAGKGPCPCLGGVGWVCSLQAICVVLSWGKFASVWESPTCSPLHHWSFARGTHGVESRRPYLETGRRITEKPCSYTGSFLRSQGSRCFSCLHVANCYKLHFGFSFRALTQPQGIRSEFTGVTGKP